ncbi:MAG: UDP-3-O-(3-hydroxymyristoyl)glucosamine N-acyltransferase [Parachlamydia sp.]|nr:UDP-3-O-(3-hydroxymyristoyl)glucosamine N-acyltransferase [Parachlamydia sp.]
MTKRTFTLKELADLTIARLIGDPDYRIQNVADLESATGEDASFFSKIPYGQVSRYEKALEQTAAGVIFIHPEIPLIQGKNYLLHEDPSRAFQITLEAIKGKEPFLTGFSGIHPTAVVHPTAKLSKDVTVGPHAIVDEKSAIGERTHIGAGCYIGPETSIGSDCRLHPHVTVREQCTIGNRVILQPGVVIGSCGFGYTTDRQGKHIKLNQVGTVIIEDDVEIGANTTIDRSRFKTTRIGRGTKIDNLVQIGHGAVIGPDNLIVALTGVAGSSETGRHVVLAGQCGINGHIKIADGVILSARSGASKSITKPGKYGGVPAMPIEEHNRLSVLQRNLEKYVERIRALEERLASLEKS